KRVKAGDFEVPPGGGVGTALAIAHGQSVFTGGGKEIGRNTRTAPGTIGINVKRCIRTGRCCSTRIMQAPLKITSVPPVHMECLGQGILLGLSTLRSR
ncbi:MAG TPA: hypothetical protein PKK85_05855, partial [Methanobacteriaceae archaeon]|nr:hypothetical protein [Methanobacteriaceae archaeon]